MENFKLFNTDCIEGIMKNESDVVLLSVKVSQMPYHDGHTRYEVELFKGDENQNAVKSLSRVTSLKGLDGMQCELIPIKMIMKLMEEYEIQLLEKAHREVNDIINTDF